MGAEDDVNQPEHHAQGQHPKFSGHCSAPVGRSTKKTAPSWSMPLLHGLFPPLSVPRQNLTSRFRLRPLPSGSLFYGVVSPVIPRVASPLLRVRGRVPCDCYDHACLIHLCRTKKKGPVRSAFEGPARWGQIEPVWRSRHSTRERFRRKRFGG